jgi:hypothetical protein
MDLNHNIDASNENQDEAQPLLYNRPPEPHHDRTISNSAEDRIVGINTIDDEDKETQPLLDEYTVEPSPAGFFLCRNIPARYSIAIWAFFGFVCLYAMRVNLSVAIVAMVSKSSI